MSDLQSRLIECFTVVFPDLDEPEIPKASPFTVGAWDSVATVNLIAVLEQEFDLNILPADLPNLASFDRVLAYVRAKVSKKEDFPTK